MTTIGSFEAKKNLSKLLDRVRRGERFVITKRGMPVAQLVPVVAESCRDRRDEVIAEIKTLREKRPRVGREGIRTMIEEGRRSLSPADLVSIDSFPDL